MSPQGVMTRKQASYIPGLNPIKGKKFFPGTQTGSRDEFSSLSLGITKISPLSPVLVDQSATEPLLQFSPRDTQGRLGSKKPQSRAAPREPIGDYIASYSGMSRDPKKAHHMPARDVIQRLLALIDQRRRCSNGLKDRTHLVSPIRLFIVIISENVSNKECYL